MTAQSFSDGFEKGVLALKRGKPLLLTLLFAGAAAIGVSAFFIPLQSYPTSSIPAASGLKATVEPTWVQVNKTLIDAQTMVSALDQLGPNGYHFKPVSIVPLDSRTRLNSSVTVKGSVKQVSGSKFNLYMFNQTGLSSWENGGSPTPYYIGLNTLDVSFQFSLKANEAVSPIFFTIETTENFVDVTIQTRVDYILIGAIHKSFLTNYDRRIPDDAIDLVLQGNATTTDQGTYNFYILDDEPFNRVMAGQSEAANVPTIFSAPNASTSVYFNVPLKGVGPRPIHFLVESAQSVGNPVHVVISADVDYKQRVTVSGAQSLIGVAAGVSQFFSLAAGAYPQLYLLGGIIIFAGFLAAVQMFVLVGFGHASEWRLWRRLDTLKEKLYSRMKRKAAPKRPSCNP